MHVALDKGHTLLHVVGARGTLLWLQEAKFGVEREVHFDTLSMLTAFSFSSFSNHVLPLG